MLHAIVHGADIQDRDGGILLLATLFGRYPFLKKLFADGGLSGTGLPQGASKSPAPPQTEIVKRSDQAKGFVVLPAVGLSSARLLGSTAADRLAEDWENLNRKALAFLRLASIRLMLRKLCNPA